MTDLAIPLAGRKAPAPVLLNDYRRRAEVGRIIERCRNTFGAPLGAVARGLLIDVCINPHDATWDEAYGVIVAPDLSLWEAVLMFTEYDVTKSPHYVAQRLANGAIRMTRTEWSATPTREQLMATLRALQGTSEGSS